MQHPLNAVNFLNTQLTLGIKKKKEKKKNALFDLWPSVAPVVLIQRVTEE